VRRPGGGRRDLQRFLGRGDRLQRIIAALRLDEQAAQAEQPRVFALGHRIERAMRAGAVAGELRCLRGQHQHQRILRGMPFRDAGMAARRLLIAGADRDQPLGDRIAAAGFAARPGRESHPPRQAPERAEHGPEQHQRGDGETEAEHGDRQGGADPPAAPHQRDVAALVGDPGGRQARRADQRQKDDNPHH
jgi:hypothetical protein